jgi:2-methylcitrate dehydratase
MVAVPLIFGTLRAEDYEDSVAADPRIDALRARMQVRENPAFTADYYAPDRRYIGNAVQVHFSDGTSTPRVQVDVPLGHRERRAEALPLLRAKFEHAVDGHFRGVQAAQVRSLFDDPERLDTMPVGEFMGHLALQSHSSSGPGPSRGSPSQAANPP